MPIEHPTISVADLRKELEGLKPTDRISFGGLDFFELKRRADDLYQIEFDQTVYLTAEGRVGVNNH